MNGVASFSPISCPFQHMWQWKPDELAFSLRSQDLLIHSACRPRNEDGMRRRILLIGIWEMTQYLLWSSQKKTFFTFPPAS